jgi:hypothetical protein
LTTNLNENIQNINLFSQASLNIELSAEPLSFSTTMSSIKADDGSVPRPRSVAPPTIPVNTSSDALDHRLSTLSTSTRTQSTIIHNYPYNLKATSPRPPNI